MTNQKYDPNALYFARTRIRRTANCVQGQPKGAAGTVYVEAAQLDEAGNIDKPTLFTMSDRSPEEVQLLVDQLGTIAPAPVKK